MESGKIHVGIEARESRDTVKTAGLVAEFVSGLMQAHQTLSGLTSEVHEFDDGERSEFKRSYVRLLLAVCAAAARNQRIHISGLRELAGMETKITVRRHIDVGLKAGHLRQDRDPSDARNLLISPTERTMQVFLEDMSSIARIITKIAHLEAEDVDKLRGIADRVGGQR
jgi:hypothetical protein